ncbi:50S ribosomal protein L6 [Amygdalobacter nucleatus]|uniref:Large ribosomal subunit protein uL6 n=1 Tax=Amygdalobacter nucleatus TaxID=3029274 RepID=A0A133Y6X8_9FIRM|nr:50S ribosomal protein L6 [Amygdalobacter nucleatus]KXB38954.1 ribosomal protein L6 [Amygdalobacter nucleatus]MDF0485306.1 50S ribosomal protein L6 [Amygdalobacter nucleatus]
MSRIGKKPIVIPQGVTVTVQEHLVTVKGAKESLTEKVHPLINVKVESNEILVSRTGDTKEERSLHGLTRALIQNMVIGVTQGYTKELEVKGTGYRAQLSGKKLVLNLGYSHPVEFVAPAGIAIQVENNKITIKGADKQLVGEVAANIRGFRVPDAYHGKGVKYLGEVLHLKEGKTGAKK